MNLKKWISFCMVPVLISTMLAGCKMQEPLKESPQQMQGTYEEKVLVVPWEEGKEYLGSFLNSRNQLEIYLGDYDENMELVNPCGYVYDSQKGWEEVDTGWIEKIIQQQMAPFYLKQGEDGMQYLLASEKKSQETSSDSQEASYAVSADDSQDEMQTESPLVWHFYQYSKEGEEKEVALDCFDVSRSREGAFYPYYMGITKSGYVALVGLENGIKVYDPETGEKVSQLKMHDVQTNNDGMYAIDGDVIATLGEDNENVLLYDAASGKEQGSFSVKDQFRGYLAKGKEDFYYLCNTNGIFAYRSGGEIEEKLFDGALGAMGSQSAVWLNFIADETQETTGFYGVYQENGKVSVSQYVYNDKASASSDTALSIYGLYENSLLEEAVHIFQQKHPEVKVDYQYAVKRYSPGNVDDSIKALNTQLLNGKGPDILVLDDLPVSSYIEKGILKDVTKLSEALTEQGELLKPVADSMSQEGKVYGIPGTYLLPVVYGTSAMCEVMKDLDAFAAYAKEHNTENILGEVGYTLMARLLFYANYQDIVKEDHTWDTDKIEKILTIAKEVGDQGENTQTVEEAFRESQEEEGDALYRRNPFSTGNYFQMYKNDEVIGIESIQGLMSLCYPNDVAEKKGYQMENLHNLFLPRNILAVNQATKEEKLAEEFIETVLSEKVQDIDSYEGLPVNVKSLEKYPDIVEKNGTQPFMSNSNNQTGEFYEAGYPVKERAEEFVKLAKEIQTPLIIDRTLDTAFVEAAQRFFDGDLTAREAAKEMEQTVETYLSE